MSHLPAGPPDLRPYQPGDRAAVVALWYRAWHAAFPGARHPQPFDTWQKRFDAEILPKGTTWVAVAGGRVVAFMTLVEADGYLDQLFVDPEAQGGGAGTALLSLAKARCPGGLTLHTLQANAAARAFYAWHGFTPGAAGVNAVNGQPNIAYHWRPAT